LIDLIERFEAEQRAREDWIKENTRENTRKEDIKFMIDFIPLEKIAEKYNMTVEEVNELLNDSSH